MTTFAIEELSNDQIDALIALHVIEWTDAELYSFSTKLDFAIKVVEKLVDLGFYVHLSHTDETGEWEWEARIEEKPKKRSRHDARQIWVAFDKSLPRAICEAALRWSRKCEDPEVEV